MTCYFYPYLFILKNCFILSIKQLVWLIFVMCQWKFKYKYMFLNPCDIDKQCFFNLFEISVLLNSFYYYLERQCWYYLYDLYIHFYQLGGTRSFMSRSGEKLRLNLFIEIEISVCYIFVVEIVPPYNFRTAYLANKRSGRKISIYILGRL